MSKDVIKLNKRKIVAKMNDFEKRMLSAKNALERVQVLNDMEDILEAEIIHWQQIYDKEKTDDPKENKNLEDSCTEQLANLQDVVNMIIEQRKELLSDAKEIAAAMKRSHVDVKPTKHITDEN
jgi:hypothetical protein